MIVVVSDDLLRQRIGKALREERKAAISPSHLSDIERGEKEGSSEVIRGVHRALGLDLDQLLKRAVVPDTAQLSLVA
ncbi:helix-turn-helix transcriptional regulator [Staphylococcus chromogenes]|nr:helix-turn-helix transcriptional regulator [Staphylococcus chromogenes]